MNKNIKLAKLYLLLFSLIYTIIIIILKNYIYIKNNSYCFYDPLINLLTPINRFWKNNYFLKSFFLIFNGAIIDLINITYWILFMKKGRYFVGGFALAFFYFIRQFMFNLFLFPIPKSNIFFKPVIKSILVPYYLTNDYYYSGHAGNMFFYWLTHHKLKNWKFFYFCIFSFIYTILFLITYSAHYSIDIIIGTMVMYISFTKVKNSRYIFKFFFLNLYSFFFNKLKKKDAKKSKIENKSFN